MEPEQTPEELAAEEEWSYGVYMRHTTWVWRFWKRICIWRLI